MKTPHISHAEVISDASGSLEIHWTLHPPGHPVSVHVASQHDADDAQHRVLAEQLRESPLKLHDLPSGQRHYFKLSTGDDALVTVAERRVPLDGARNFRDMGGYSTTSGQRIRWGKLFRSDYLVHLTDSDCEYIANLGIRTVFDLRSNMERENYPSRWPAQSQVENVFWEDSRDVDKRDKRDVENLGRRLKQYYEKNSASEDGKLHGFLSSHYRRYLEVQAEKYREILFRLVTLDAAPALIHCTAGKDRTGIICALLLHLLGVDEDTIMQDYLLTNRSVRAPDEEERFRLLLRQFGLDEVSDRVFEAMFYAHPEYLQAAFDGMRERFGSVEQYVEERLGFDATRINQLRSLYLE